MAAVCEHVEFFGCRFLGEGRGSENVCLCHISHIEKYLVAFPPLSHIVIVPSFVSEQSKKKN